VDFIRRVAEDRQMRDLPDQELLRRFRGQQDQAAFHTLLRRHGPVVLDVCRGVLGNEADAEDAFQATFLVLARKADSIRKTESLGSWLHGVAYRTALKARAQLATRQKHEARVPVRPACAPDDLSWREARQVVHEEVGGLPERYRAVVVLCYLEEATQEAAAAQLGLAKSTLGERLERGRALLRRRLLRRGLGPVALLTAMAWPAAVTSASVPLALVAASLKAATGTAAGSAAAPVVSAKVAALTEVVLKTMFVAKIKAVAVVLLVAAVLTTASAGILYRAVAGQSGTEQDQAALETQPLKSQGTAEPSARSGEKVAKASLPSVEVVTQYLRKKYPEQGDDAAGRRRLVPGTKVTEVDNALLRKQLPRTRFFLTKLDTDFFDYWEVPLLVSASVADGKVIFRESFSPVFTDVPGKFLAQFRGLQARSADDRKAVGEAIGNLLQRITERGELRNGNFSSLRGRIELWSAGHGWRDIHFEFDLHGRLQSVSLSIHRDE
jgi:RNA polymerase sigma factor (sigma-70 family)